MRKMLKIIIVFAVIALLCGCGAKDGQNFTESDRFVIVSGKDVNAPYREVIIVDKETGVLYLTIRTIYSIGITPLLDSDGMPLLWDGKE